MNIHTILFDLDGTLIDTNELIIASFMHTFTQHGKSISREQAIEFIGPPLKESLQKADPKLAENMIETYRKHNVEHHDDYVTAFPNVEKTLKALQRNNIQLGVVTTKMRGTVDMGLRVTGLDNYFATIVTLDDVTHAKPHPEPIIKAMTSLNANSSSTLMVGDNSHDIEAGHNAGVKTAGVAWSLKGKETLLTYQPSYMLDDMQDLLGIPGV
ncbi:pyrophosphatase PpaX [Lentibacillus amyloliquefaciens]|uniref:Pyrophosphatase n=1 Tax=Lentibacillus amyloliquefaciens TaxID=1472767 RepID=A0A0U3WKI1_9BACI|nr:pyrophosphatase PpaX [Lentibacillus amyloliquefaciens]ALX50367.1 pyrophosphatase [Lentibacillus amyloliquefaciens]